MNNIQFASMIVGFVALLLTVMGGAWLNQRGLERQMGAQRKEFDAKLETLSVKIDALSDWLGKIETLLSQFFKPVLPGRGD